MSVVVNAGASNSCIGSMQALYGKPSVDHSCNINDEVQFADKAKATSLPDILLVDFNPCEVSRQILSPCFVAILKLF